MLSEEVIKELVSTPAFISNASKLAYMLHMSQRDASQELLIELLDHRLHKWSDKELTLAIQRDQQNLKWKIKYAYKDYYRRFNKEVNKELEKAQMVSHMTPQSSNQAETLEALERLQELFKNKATRTWAKSVLLFGRRETMIQFHQTRRQFNNKLTKVCKYARQHRQHNQSSSNVKELELLKEWSQLMANESTSDSDVQAFIGQHEAYINEVINSPQVAFQGRLIKDFEHAGKDKYTFNEFMHTRYIKLEQEKLKENK